MTETRRSFCRFCIALCGIDVDVEADRVIKVRGVPEDPLSAGYTCSKGRALPAFHHHPDRLNEPLLRAADGSQHGVEWNQMLEDLGSRLDDVIASSGPDTVATYLGTGVAFDASGRRMGVRFGRAIGSRSQYSSGTLDTPCKPMIAEMMGGQAGLNPTIDWERTTMTILIGSNPVVSHGHVSPFVDPVRRLRSLAAQGELWVIDPRNNESAKLATRHVPVRPGTDYALLAFAVRQLLESGADRDYLASHTTADAVDSISAATEPFDLERTAELTGLEPTELEDFVAAIRRHGRIAGLTGTGVTMSPQANCVEWLLWALLIVTGSFDRPGGMWFNPGYLRQLDQRNWTPATGEAEPGPDSRPELPRRIGEYPTAALLDEIDAGNVRALFILGGSPLSAFPEVDRTEKMLQRLDVLAVADVVATPTTRIATHVLPVAGQLERADLPSFIDQFHPIVATRYTPAVVPPAEQRKPLWWIMAALASRMGHDILPPGVGLDATDDDLLAAVAARSRAGGIEGIQEGGIDNVAEEPIVFGWVLPRLPDGKWRLAPPPLVEQLSTLAAATGPVLIPHRNPHNLNSQLADQREQEHGRIELSREDAAALELDDGALVALQSPTGRLVGPVRIAESLSPGAVSVPHGFAEVNVGHLTSATSAIDSLTGMVTLSTVPVDIAPASEAEESHGTG